MRAISRTTATIALAAASAVALSACGSSSGTSTGAASKTVTLVSHDSFAISKKAQANFERSSGLKLKILRSGDAGAAVNQAVLTKDNPQGDVFFGVDNTLLGKAEKAGLFTPYAAAGLAKVPAKFQLDAGQHRVTPIDYGDVCVNYDKKYFQQHHLAVPTTMDDLAKPQYKNLLVTENAATSSPGLAFLLASVAKYGDSGWQGYWKKLDANGLKVVDGWEQAYDSDFTGAAAAKGHGTRPLVVSYDTSPPAEVSDPAKTPASAAPTGIIADTCFRQVEFAGLLHGAKNAEGGKKLIDFLLNREYQAEVPDQMYMWASRGDVKAPTAWTKYVDVPADPHTLAPAVIDKNRDQWVKAWSSLVLK
ncbi:thiamine ABC transporter substrate-binding protein [Mangrovactinospora gilvigrisea]|uniref:Thiamine ABC transporter substrate-binding protein n=1 Tax=Mangrovactinospora gilvigrisea TaxID=1428644 RepID=A0A1J7BQ03_9ACTN|nr:thiamine ABC transporter substrate-binding protein [Mangrovactinospora gilvigrisea]OIV35529.1 thiamine ABC transporter substrate-binding protein [Mangrovactinospora gilvigrisea]